MGFFFNRTIGSSFQVKLMVKLCHLKWIISWMQNWNLINFEVFIPSHESHFDFFPSIKLIKEKKKHVYERRTIYIQFIWTCVWGGQRVKENKKKKNCMTRRKIEGLLEVRSCTTHEIWKNDSNEKRGSEWVYPLVLLQL